jgi:hypothetical protein
MNSEPPPQLEFPLLESSTARGRRKSESKTSGFLVVPSRVRQYALEVARRERYHSFTGVSVEFIQRIDARLRNIIRQEVERHPSKGKRLA